MDIKAADNRALKGATLALLDQLDSLFLEWANQHDAEPLYYQPLLPAAKLNQANHFSSFPHQAMMVVSADPTHENLQNFSDNPMDDCGHLNLPELSPTTHCLTPGACYPIYIEHEGEDFSATSIFTVRSPCFRREDTIQPLVRQMAFSMREIVCIGSEGDVAAFLAHFHSLMLGLFENLKLPIELIQATDPFFNPRRNRKYIMQKVAPVKHEMTYNGSLAIGSINNHLEGFGNTFDIKIAGNVAHSGCVAFGLERWVHCWLEHFGCNPDDWPSTSELREASGNGKY